MSERSPLPPILMLAVVAGGAASAWSIAVVASDPTLGFAATRVLGGLVFMLGLTLVMVGGAELFAAAGFGY